jgi:glucose-6-phosphate 1-epimerase
MQKSTGDARHTEQIEAHGLKALRLRSSGSEALVYLHGAHVAAFSTAEQGELLWTSSRAVYQAGKAIRGGVPLCFPWFGAHKTRADLPAHGFARTRAWEFAGSEQQADDVVAELTLSSSIETQAWYPHAFQARLRIRVGQKLSLAFEVENRGPSSLAYELALHAYLGVSDVRQVALHGLKGATYADKVSGAQGLIEQSAALNFVGETDRVYQSATRLSVDDPASKRRIVIEKAGSASTVVWNPWLDRAQRMSDFGADEWPKMLCVEAANAGSDSVELAPGARHVTSATVSAEAI